MTSKELNETLATLDDLTTLADVKRFMKDLLTQWGVHTWSVGLKTNFSLRSAPLVVLSTYPYSWLAEYAIRGYIRLDPLVYYAQTESLPLIWDAAKGWEHLSPQEQKFMVRAKERGWLCGLCIPIHSAEWAYGILSCVMRDQLEKARPQLEALEPVSTYIALRLSKAIHRIYNTSHPHQRPQLTQREIDCLRWASDGKTSWEIAAILGLSESTTNQHLQAAINKLGTTNRSQAIARGIAQGIVRPYLEDNEVLNDPTFDSDQDGPGPTETTGVGPCSLARS